MKDDFVLREKRILSLIDQEIGDGEEMADAVRHIAEDLLLTEKGFAPGDISSRVLFDVRLQDEIVRSQVDFVISLDSRLAMIVKCAAGSLASRERHVVALARVFSESVVPVAVVMDPMDAVVLDGITGKTLGEGFEAIPTKDRLRTILNHTKQYALAPEKKEREKRVLLAFDAIRCCIPRGKEGGVRLDETKEGI